MQQLKLFTSVEKKEFEKPLFIKVASWNVNSVRARKNHIKEWLRKESPDLVCLQETKVKDSEFPIQDFFSMGYSVISHGESGYNGVAILSKFRLENVIRGFTGSPDDSARVISADLFGIKFFSIYAPNARPGNLDSMNSKIDWYKKFTEYLKKNHLLDKPILLCGDFNVATQDFETFNPKHWLCTTIVNVDSRNAFSNLLNHGFRDIMREKNPSMPLYTWWGYGEALTKNNGMRLDYFLSTKNLVENISENKVDYETRTKQKTSDHAPIICKVQLKS